jgi:methionyl-tRNA synthetase
MARGEALFPRAEFSLEAAEVKPAAPGSPDATAEITLEEFRRLDLRVAEIREARAVPGSKKLVELKVAAGSDERTIVAGILLDYPPADLVGKQVVIVANLKPTKLMGVESRGMLLAVNESDGRIVLVTPEKRAAPGSRVK